MEQFPIGSDFLAANVCGRAIIWGGLQRQPQGAYVKLPANVVYSFAPNEGTWEVMEAEATVSIHPGTFLNAFAVLDSKIFIFGGDTGGYVLTNALSTLSCDGDFETLHPEGWIPSPRGRHQGFTHNQKLYFLGGIVAQIDESRKKDYVEYKEKFLTNELIEYDPNFNAFTRLSIRGPRLSPRIGFALAILEDRVFIHGGVTQEAGSRIVLKDFYVLDVTSLELTQIKEAGYSTPLSYHVSIPISNRHVLFVGGENADAVINQVKIFDVEKREWEEEEPISSEIGAGLSDNQAASFPRKNCFSVLCLGGYIDWEWKTHPNYMVLFNVTLSSP